MGILKYIILFAIAVALSYLYNTYTPKTWLAIMPAIPAAIMLIFFQGIWRKSGKIKKRLIPKWNQPLFRVFYYIPAGAGFPYSRAISAAGSGRLNR